QVGDDGFENRGVGFGSGEIAAGKEQDFHAVGVRFSYEFGLDEAVGDGEAAVGVPRDAGVVDVREFAERNLGDVIGWVQIFAAVGVVGDDALGELEGLSMSAESNEWCDD